MESSWLGLAAPDGLIIPLGEGQVGSSRGSSHYRLSHIILSCQSLQKILGCLGGELALTPLLHWWISRRMAAGGCQWLSALWHGEYNPQYHSLPCIPWVTTSCLASPSQQDLAATGQATVLSHSHKCPSREGFSC